jgi:DNA processing protein
LESLHAEILSFHSTTYPVLLKECPDAPIVLFVRGCLPASESMGIGIVGTRTPSDYGTISTQQLLNYSKGYPIYIISGLAIGIDATAHQHAINLKIPTIAILAHGFKYMYPAVHRGLADKIIAEGGAIVSEYTPSVKIEKHHFSARNRIIAGWCKLLVVIESGEKGGSLRTAAFAAQYNRDVLAVPGR